MLEVEHKLNDIARKKILTTLDTHVPSLVRRNRTVRVRVPIHSLRAVEHWFSSRDFTVGSSVPHPASLFADIVADAPR